jgi:hypothetical protein
LRLTIDGSVEKFIVLNSLSLRTIQDGVIELLDDMNHMVNAFQLEMISVDLYKQSTGDSDLSELNKRAEEAQKKKEMAQDPAFHRQIVSEYRDSFNIKETVSDVVKKQIDNKPKKDPRVISQQQERGESPLMAVKAQVEDLQKRVQMKDLVKELQNMTGDAIDIEEQIQQNYTEQLPQRRSALELKMENFEHIIQEITETQDTLIEEVNRVNLRLSRLEVLIQKIVKIITATNK